MKIIYRLWFSLLFSSTFELPISAQITPDGTTSTTVTPTETGVQIDNGDSNGGNLFHSFGGFSVPTGTEAFFNNASDIVNIFSRVTGGNISNIDGILRANGTANLFLINPAGIVFDENASLQLGGSFYGSTANSIVFPDGEFSATDLDNSPLITVNAPIGLGFRDEPGNITHRSAANGFGLAVIEGNTLALIGGDVNLENSSITFAPAGKIELGGLTATGTVEILEDASLNFPNDIDRGNVSISDSSFVATFLLGESDLDAGDINITANSLTLSNGANLNAITSTLGNGGNVVIDVKENTTLDGQNASVGIFTAALETAVGNAGLINISTGSLTLQGAATLSTSSSGNGNAGNVVINAANGVTFDGQGNTNGIIASVFSNTANRSGDVELIANSLTLNNNAIISNISESRAGDIILNVTENISLANGSSIFAPGADGGSITIEAKNLEITSGSRLSAGIFANSGSAEARGGNIAIDLTEDITIDGVGESDRQIGVFNENGGIGNAGNIEINARNISVFNGGQITSSSGGQGNIGNITLNATDSITVDGENNSNSSINQFVNEEATGNVGIINIQAQNLILTNGGEIGSSVAGTANSGDINVDVADTILIDGFAELTQSDSTNFLFPSQIGSNVGNTGNGDSGDINIDTKNLILSRNGQIDSTIFGQGNAGNISIDANTIAVGEQGNINLPPTSISSAISSSSNNIDGAVAGNITIFTDSLSIRDGAIITADARGNGFGGNIKINATDNVEITGTGTAENIENSPSSISASISPEVEANGGDIEIDTKNLSLANQGLIITSSSGYGNAGNITLNIADTFSANNFSFVLSNIGNPNGVIASGNVGNIMINAKNIVLVDATQIQAGTFSGATVEQPGVISVTATESISFTGENTGIFSNIDPNSFGDASDTRLTAPVINLNNGAVVVADNQADGQGGNVTVETEQLILSNASIIANAFGEGNAGSIVVNSEELISLTEGSSLEAVVREDATGNGGDISVTTETLNVTEGSQISTTTFGAGNAGSLTIDATNSVNLIGIQEQLPSGLLANALIGDGTGGNIFVITDRLNIEDSATITVSNFLDDSVEPGTGEAGILRVEANSVTLDNDVTIDAATQSGNGGNITFDIANNLNLQNNSQISARAFDRASGGNINIDAKFIIATPNQNNDIIASAEQGAGGEINITAESLLGIEERALNPITNDINASSDFGLEGTVSVETPDNNPLRNTAELPVRVVTSDVVTSDACSASSLEERSGLIVRGKGGVPPIPTDPFVEETLITEEQIVSYNEEEEERAVAEKPSLSNNDAEDLGLIPSDVEPVAISNTGEKLYLARGVIKKEDDTIVLTAYPTNSDVSRKAVSVGECS